MIKIENINKKEANIIINKIYHIGLNAKQLMYAINIVFPNVFKFEVLNLIKNKKLKIKLHELEEVEEEYG